MTKIVLDTNIIISAALSSLGNPAKTINLIYEKKEVQLYYSLGILAEYERVLSRARLNISQKTQDMIISAVKENGILIEPPVSTFLLPDESDRIFYDAAKSSGAILVTGNIKHFPDEPFIMTPHDFITQFAT